MKKRLQLFLTLCIVTFYIGNTQAQIWTQKGVDVLGVMGTNYSGFSVSMSSDGSVVAIGAKGNDNVNGTNSGHVRVFEWNGTAWIQKGMNINGESAEDNSGASVSLSDDGNTLAIGASNSASLTGQVRIFEWVGSAWVQKGLDLDGEAIGDEFGYSVSINSDGNTVVIGAPKNDGVGSDAGHVRVFSWSGSAWVQKGLDLDGEAASNWWGYTVSVSDDGNTIVSGAPYNGGGNARIFNWNGTSWIQKGVTINGVTYANFGYAVNITGDGNVVAVGATNIASGHVRVFEWSGTAWFQKGLNINGEASGDKFGSSLSLSADGNTIAIGAPENDVAGGNSGHARVYEWDGNVWTQKGVDIDGDYLLGQYGKSICLSSDGSHVIIGGPYNPSSLEGVTRIFSSPICVPTTGSENVTACDSYTWPANATTYTASGNPTATLTNVNGCDSVATLNLTIETIDNTVSQTGIVLTANATGYSYQWVDCDNGNAPINGETNQSFTPTVNGNYAVEISSINCTETSACTVINSVGVEEAINELGINIYPNPSNGEFNIDVKRNCNIEIVNAIGEVVLVQKLTSGANAINISTNPNGLYFINVKTKDAAYSKRIVLSK